MLAVVGLRIIWSFRSAANDCLQNNDFCQLSIAKFSSYLFLVLKIYTLPLLKKEYYETK